MAKHVAWEGVFPAVTTQFRSDFSIDYDATTGDRRADPRRRLRPDRLRHRGREQLAVPRREDQDDGDGQSAAGRVPVLVGVAEYTTAFAIETARKWRGSASTG